MNAITAVAAAVLISGCSQNNPDRELVDRFWTAALANDVAFVTTAVTALRKPRPE